MHASKLWHAILGWLVSASSATIAWTYQHIAVIASLVAIASGCFAIYASWKTIQYRAIQIKKLESYFDNEILKQ